MFFNSVKLPPSLMEIKKQLKGKKLMNPSYLTSQEKDLIEQIKEKTTLWNKNNITRTNAYLAFYHQHAEIHWALLAHMVSRNAGWNMTDLKGTLLPKLLSEKESTSYFTLLERGNWLIFHDAFPQLLLYEESKKTGFNHFHLLPHFEVSIFMEAIWNHFFMKGNSSILSTALIVNEQSYIEKPVMHNSTFQKDILQTIPFKLYDFLSFNQIVFPYFENEKVRLTGRTLHHFENLHSRILFGKKLYALLFGDDKRLKQVESWATTTPHSASRKDYRPELFSVINEAIPGKNLKPRLHHCQLVKGSPRFYSPSLQYAWQDYKHESPQTADWYKDWRVLSYLDEVPGKLDGEMDAEHCKTLEAIEMAVIAKQTISAREQTQERSISKGPSHMKFKEK